jgi:hypothetical protein
MAKGVTQKVKPKKAKKKYKHAKLLSGLDRMVNRNPNLSGRDLFRAVNLLHERSVNVGVMAEFDVPLPVEDRNTIETGYVISLDRLTRGLADGEDIGALGFLANVTVILCEKGFGKEHEQLAVASQLALINAFRRGATNGGRYGLSGDEMQAMRGVYQLHMAQLEVCGRGHLLAASAEVEKRQASGQVIELVRADDVIDVAATEVKQAA